MATYNCHHIVLFGDLNQQKVKATFDEIMAVYNLQNFVDFPTYRPGSSLDLVVTDLPPHIDKCAPLGYVEISDYEAVLTKKKLRTQGGCERTNLMEMGEGELVKLCTAYNGRTYSRGM